MEVELKKLLRRIIIELNSLILRIIELNSSKNIKI